MQSFPVSVVLPDGQAFSSCKLVDDGQTATIWRWADGSGAEQIAEGPAAVSTGPRSWTVTTPAGDAVVTMQGGCGCGHPMKHWMPSRPVVEHTR